MLAADDVTETDDYDDDHYHVSMPAKKSLCNQRKNKNTKKSRHFFDVNKEMAKRNSHNIADRQTVNRRQTAASAETREHNSI